MTILEKEKIEGEEIKVEILKSCPFCKNPLPFKKISKAEGMMKWAKDIEHQGHYSIYCFCPWCNKKIKIGQRVLKNPTHPSLEELI